MTPAEAGALCGPAVDVVFDVVGEEEAFEDAADGLFFFVAESGGGFEVESKVLVSLEPRIIYEPRPGKIGGRPVVPRAPEDWEFPSGY